MDPNNTMPFEAMLQGKSIPFIVAIAALVNATAFPPSTLNVFLAIVMALSLAILLLSIFKKNMYELSFYPSLLMAVTLARLSLNFSTAYLIMVGRGASIEIVSFFGNFAAGKNSVVGIVIFAAMAFVHYFIIAKGFERVAGVAELFTLDVIAVKCMAIDADLNSGTIDQKEALIRRHNLSRKASFCSSMAAATRFVKIDALASIIITAALFAGMGVLVDNDSAADAMQTGVLLTLGTGLVVYIPALIISVATGFVVSRMAAE